MKSFVIKIRFIIWATLLWLTEKPKHTKKVDQLLKSLNGQIVFVKGNHDSRAMFKYLEKHNATLQNARKKYLFNDVGLILKFDKKQFF